MRSVVAALSWELVARHRWAFVLTGAWLVLINLLGLLLPPSARNLNVGISLAMSLIVPLVSSICALAYGYDARLEERRSWFPRRLFTLPAPTLVLAGTPLLLGTALSFVCWMVCNLCLLRGCGLEAPLLWPALCAAAGVALLQAMVWSPFPLPWLRMVCVSIAVPGMVWMTGLLVVGLKLNADVLALLFLALLLLGYAMALAGVARGRQGVGLSEPFQIQAPNPGLPRKTPKPFVSPLRAQVWLEWRMHRWTFYFITAICLATNVPSWYFADVALMNGLTAAFPWLSQVQDLVGPSWLVLGHNLPVAFLLSMCFGVDMGLIRMGAGVPDLPPFLASRAISTPVMIQAKLLMCALGGLLVWGVMLAAAFGWALVMGRIGEMSEHLVTWTGSGLAAGGLLVGGVTLLMGLTWLTAVGSLWAGLTGRTVAIQIGAVAPAVAFCVGGVLAAVSWREEWQPLLNAGVVLALVSKMLGLVWVMVQLRRRRLMGVPALACTILGWGLLTALVGGIVLGLTSGGRLVAAMVVLLMPLTGCLAAPLALATNRTR